MLHSERSQSLSGAFGEYKQLPAVNYFGKKLHLRCSAGFRMCLCSYLCTDILFMVTRISKKSDIQGKWFNASIKFIKSLCMMLILALVGHILNLIFKMKYEKHAHGIELKSKM